MRSGDSVVGKYRLVRKLGSGGMGVVWEARHVVTGRPFAIKFLSSPGHEEHYARFLLEAKVSGLVRHPNIVDVYDVGTARELGDVPFLVMDLLDGLSLSEVLAASRQLSVRQTLALMLPLLSAISAAHEAGVLHRDLKPSNLFLHRLSAAGAGTMPTMAAIVPKLLDFGISKLVGPAREGDSASDGRHRLTRTGTVLGSPLYMSPEQVRGETTLDARSDLHAMGAILWECLSGKPLFSPDLDDRELAAQISNGARAELSAAWPECPAALSKIVDRCIALRRDDRFGTARELLTELDGLRASLGLSTSLSEANDALEVFPVLAHPSPGRGLDKTSLERATTVDSDFPPAFTDPPEVVSHPDAPMRNARSLTGWGEKEGPTGSKTIVKRRWQSLVLAAVGGGVLVLGIVRIRITSAEPQDGPRTVAAGQAADPQAAAPSPPPTPPTPRPPAAAPATTEPATAVSPPSIASSSPPHVPSSPPRRAAPAGSSSSAHVEVRIGPDAAAGEAIGTSANGAPIIR